MISPDALKALTDEELSQVIRLAEAEIKERTDTRRRQAIEQIKEIAATARIHVSFNGSRGGGAGNGKSALKAGDKYQHPTEATKVYVVGKGRPPAWFEALRAKGKLPVPVSGTK